MEPLESEMGRVDGEYDEEGVCELGQTGMLRWLRSGLQSGFGCSIAESENSGWSRP